MARRYSLERKVKALNQIERQEGDIRRAGDVLGIPAETLRAWQRQEEELRRQYRKQSRGEWNRRLFDLQQEMLERSVAIMEQLDEERLAEASLNQLASALGNLVSQVLKLEEVIKKIDDGKGHTTRFQYYYDGQLHKAPPWADASEDKLRAFQDRRLRETLGEDGAWQDYFTGERANGGQARLVAGADLSDGEPGLAGSESGREASALYQDQRG